MDNLVIRLTNKNHPILNKKASAPSDALAK
jgi:hypothetical protein